MSDATVVDMSLQESCRAAARHMSVEVALLAAKADELQGENAKLRELVVQMYPRAKAFLQMGVQLGCNDTLSYDWELQMQEMGIEVPE